MRHLILALIGPVAIALDPKPAELNLFGHNLAPCDRTGRKDPLYLTTDGTHHLGALELRRGFDSANSNGRCQHKALQPGYWVCADVPASKDDSEWGAWWYASSGLRLV